MNASVLPTGQVLVFSGLFNAITSDDELAAVLGHEISHVIAGHLMEKLSSDPLSNLILAPSFPVSAGAFIGVLELMVIALPPAAIAVNIAMALSRN